MSRRRVPAAAGRCSFACGNRRDGIGAQRRVAPGGVSVDDRILADDGDRTGERSDRERRVDDSSERSGELDAFALRRLPAGEREADRIRSEPQMFQAVASVAIGDGRPRLFDEGRAGGDDRDARKESPAAPLTDPAIACANAVDGRAARQETINIVFIRIPCVRDRAYGNGTRRRFSGDRSRDDKSLILARVLRGATSS